jgi:hypothetical protein
MPDAGIEGEDLGRAAANALLPIIERIRASPASLAATTPPPPGGKPSLPPMPALPGFTPPRNWDQREVLRALSGLGKIGHDELRTLPARLGIATSLAAGALTFPGLRSTMQVGNIVHPVLQQRYRERYLPNLIVADRQVSGGAQKFNLAPLSEAATMGPPSLGALYLAWLNTRWVSSRRSDLTDMSRRVNWEIKPMLQAPLGVLQEAWYRCSYNWTAYNMAATNPALRGLLPMLDPGPPWEPSLQRMISLGAVRGVPSAAVPYSTSLLPGLLLYAVVSGPTMIDMAILAALILQLIEKEMKRRLQQVEAAVAVVLRGLAVVVEAIAAAVAEYLEAVLVAIVILGLAAALVFLAPPAVVTGLAVATAAAIVFVIERFASEPDSAGPSRQPQLGQGQVTPWSKRPTMITMDFPGVSVRMPVDEGNNFVTAVEFLLARALGAMGENLKRYHDSAMA